MKRIATIFFSFFTITCFAQRAKPGLIQIDSIHAKLEVQTGDTTNYKPVLQNTATGKFKRTYWNTFGSSGGSPWDYTLPPASGSNNTMLFSNTSTTDGIPLAVLRSSSGTNTVPGLSLVPRGTGQFDIRSQFVLFNTDWIADGTNYEGLFFRGMATEYLINSTKGGTGTVRPIKFQIDGSTALGISTGSVISMPQLGSTGNRLIARNSSSELYDTGIDPANIPTLASGTYTPTLTGTSNVNASTAYQCQYSRIGDVITVSGKIQIDPTATAATVIRISLPVTTDFANEYECAGTGALIISTNEAASIKADVTNNEAELRYVSEGTTTDIFFQFTYKLSAS
jgi:hypothetical protein